MVVKQWKMARRKLLWFRDITVFLSGTWSSNADQQAINLEITGGASAVREGSGVLLLGEDDKSVVRLTIKGVSRTTKRTFEVNFEGK